MTRIAVLLTCFNRRAKTIACLDSLRRAIGNYIAIASQKKTQFSIFLTDDGCTDGTADAAREACKEVELHIIQGDGRQFWAGGMRMAWQEALRQSSDWDFFLLLNDDTVLRPNAIEELMTTHAWCIEHCGCSGMYSGITCANGHPEIITYSGDVFESSAKGKWHRLGPTGTPQPVDQCNANILLVSHEVVERIGIFHEGYTHGGADLDYCMQARSAGLPALVTAHIAGECEYDHISEKEECERLMRMSLSERRKYVTHPTHSDKDYLLFVKRNIPHKYAISVTLRAIRLYCPSIYYYINKVRGLY